MPHREVQANLMGCCDGDIPDEEIVVSEILIHMIASDVSVACGVKLDTKEVHGITSDLERVSCGDCRIKWLHYVNEQLQSDLAKEKEKVRVAEQATGMVRSELRRATLEVGRQRRQIRHLRESLDYELGRGGRHYYPVPRH